MGKNPNQNRKWLEDLINSKKKLCSKPKWVYYSQQQLFQGIERVINVYITYHLKYLGNS